MQERDYILRIIEILGEALVRLRKRIMGGEDPAEVEGDLQDVAEKGGVDLELARQVDEDTLLLLMSPGGEPEPARCWLTAELLYLDGLRAELEEKEGEARSLFEKALRLYVAIDPRIPGRGLPEVADRVAELEERLGGR